MREEPGFLTTVAPRALNMLSTSRHSKSDAVGFRKIASSVRS